MPSSDDPRDGSRETAPSEEYQFAEEHLPNLTEFELNMLAGALVAEWVNRGNDHDTALENVIEAATAGQAGSRIFDAMAD